MYQTSLYQYINNKQGPTLSTVNSLNLFKQLINALENLHSIGFTHNDIKPENVMIDSELKVTLIDLGFATKFKDKTGKLLESKEITKFVGNLLYSSLDQMQFKSTAAKDDV
jgi:serine/threonine protein kinase